MAGLVPAIHVFPAEWKAWMPATSATSAGMTKVRLPHQLLHRPVEAFDGERIHPLAHQLAHHADRVGVLPLVLGDGVEPDAGRIGAGDAVHPHRARLLVEMLD